VDRPTNTPAFPQSRPDGHIPSQVKRGLAGFLREAFTRKREPLRADHSAAEDHAEQQHQDARTDERDHHLDDDVGHADAYQAGQPATQERAQDPDDDVPDQSKAVAVI
jgi:hypothetical protein